jgi:exodeoxyribonuclease VII large subunit
MQWTRIAARFLAEGQRRLQIEGSRLQVVKGRLSALDPLAVLARGYALVLDDQQRPVVSVRGLSPGQPVGLAFGDGKARALVTEIEPAAGKPRAA